MAGSAVPYGNPAPGTATRTRRISPLRSGIVLAGSWSGAQQI